MSHRIKDIDLEVSAMLWHPSASAHFRHCCDFPGHFTLASERIHAAFMNDRLYVGGVFRCTIPDRCRLFEYTLSKDAWDMLDTNISEFALASFESKLVLIGGLEHKVHDFEHSSRSLTNKVWAALCTCKLRNSTVHARHVIDEEIY